MELEVRRGLVATATIRLPTPKRVVARGLLHPTHLRRGKEGAAPGINLYLGLEEERGRKGGVKGGES